MSNLTNPRGSWAVRQGIARLPRLGVGLVAAAGLLALGIASMGPVSAQTIKNQGGVTAGSYVAVTPFRVADTRPNSGQPYAGKTLTAGGSLNVQVTGTASDVPASATAVVLNVTAVDPTAAGFLTVYPEGGTLPVVSSVNFAAGSIVPNAVTVGLSATGMVTVYNNTGSTNVVVDVDGYYTASPPSAGSGLYNAVAPTRVFGTLANGSTVGANSTTAVTVAGASANDGVPSTASAVVANITAAGATLPSYLSVYPAGGTVPVASSLNFGAQVANQAIANRVTVGVSSTGAIDIYNLTGSVRVDVDIDGYYSGPGGTGSTFVPVTPIRVTDTRVPTNGSPIAPSTTESFNLATNSSGEIPADAAAVASNFTVVPGDAPGYLTVYPTTDTTNPTASDVNWTANESPAVPNFTIAQTNGTTGAVDVYNSHGATVNLLIDVFGYFTPSGIPSMVSATVTNTTLTITYNQDVNCPTAGANDVTDFTYDWTGAASGGAVTTTTCAGSGTDVLTLGGTFTLPSGTATLTYNAPSATNTAANSVASTATGTFAATQTIGVPVAVAPAMVSAYTTNTTLVITYNEDVTCDASGTIPADFTYDYTGIASGFTGAVTAACSGDTLTLTAATSVSPPTSTSTLVYTAPTTPSSTNAVYATGSTPAFYAATQTLTGSQWTTPAITGAVVTPGASGTGTIAVTYSEATDCPTVTADVQTLFDYSNGGAAAYPSTCADTSADVITLGTFYNATTGTAVETLVLPGASDTLTYTSPGTPTTANAAHSTVDFPQFADTQTFALTPTAAPAMNTTAGSAVVTAGVSIAITYTEAPACPATGADGDFVYDFTAGGPAEAVTGCSASGDVLTLTGAFNAAAGSASIAYTEPGTPSTSNAVYAANTTTDFAASQTLSGSQITN